MDLGRCLGVIEAGKIAAMEELGRMCLANELGGEAHSRSAYDIERSFAAIQLAIEEPAENLAMRNYEAAKPQLGIVRRLESMGKAERMKIFRQFCSRCGTVHIPCDCYAKDA